MDAVSEEKNGTESYRDEAGLTPAQRTWLEHIRQSEAEGLSFKQYCSREGLAVQSLYTARKALRNKGMLSAPDASPAASPPRFAAVRLAQPSSPVTADALLPNGVQLRVSCETGEQLTALVNTLAKL